MQRAYEDDNGTPTDRATFNLQRRQARQADHTSAPAMSPRENAAFKQANQHFEAEPPAVARRRAAAAAWRAERETARVSDPQGASRCAARQGQPVHGPR